MCFQVTHRLIFNTGIYFISAALLFSRSGHVFCEMQRRSSLKVGVSGNSERSTDVCWTRAELSPLSTTMSVSKACPVGFHWSFTSVKLTRYPYYMCSLGESLLRMVVSISRFYFVMLWTLKGGWWPCTPPDRLSSNIFSGSFKSCIEASQKCPCVKMKENAFISRFTMTDFH